VTRVKGEYESVLKKMSSDLRKARSKMNLLEREIDNERSVSSNLRGELESIKTSYDRSQVAANNKLEEATYNYEQIISSFKSKLDGNMKIKMEKEQELISMYERRLKSLSQVHELETEQIESNIRREYEVDIQRLKQELGKANEMVNEAERRKETNALNSQFEVQVWQKKLEMEKEETIAAMQAQYGSKVKNLQSDLNERTRQVEQADAAANNLQQQLKQERENSSELKQNLEGLAQAAKEDSIASSNKIKELSSSYEDRINSLEERLIQTEKQGLKEELELYKEMRSMNKKFLRQSHDLDYLSLYGDEDDSSNFCNTTKASSRFAPKPSLGQAEAQLTALKDREEQRISAEARTAIKQAETAIEVATRYLNLCDLKSLEKKVESKIVNKSVEHVTQSIGMKNSEVNVEALVQNTGNAVSSVQQKVDALFKQQTKAQLRPYDEKIAAVIKPINITSESNRRPTSPRRKVVPMFFASEEDN